MFDEFTATLLAALALSAPNPPLDATPAPEDKPIFMRSFEHAPPSVLEYKVAGLYGSRDTPYVVALRFRAGQWDVQLKRDGQLLLRARLHQAYNRISISRVVVASQDGDRQFMVYIPYGFPHSNCFANGDEVYSHLTIESSGRINIQHFPNCALEEISPQIRKSGQVFLVGPPPRTG